MNIVLTATISPCTNQPYLSVSDPKARLKQYREAVAFYLGCSEVSGVILCDNSQSVGSDFSSEKALSKKLGKSLEIMYMHTDDKMISQYGKGYGEAEILDYVVIHSALLANGEPFFKVTGRLLLLNTDTLIRQSKKDKADIFINVCGQKSVDSRFFITTASIYKQIFSQAKYSVNDREGKYLENVYYEIITSCGIPTACFRRFPRVKGQSGSLGYHYNDCTLKRRVKLAWRDIFSIFNFYKVR